jgi:TM2 domain-containing membrane protein YozV/RNA polymerase subunit RPABC4/transcription elongation factor Spt4
MAGHKVRCPKCSSAFDVAVPKGPVAVGLPAKGSDEKYCIECGSAINVKAVICPKCGVAQSALHESGNKHCSECGAVIRAKAVVCPRCGVPQGGQKPVSKRIVAGVCALLFGPWGVHKFILGYPLTGLLTLAISLLGILLFFIPTLVMYGVSIAEGIIYLSKTDDEFVNRYQSGYRLWF